MPFAKLPQNRLTKMTSLVVALSTLAALAYLGWALSDATSTTPAHSISATDDHYPVMMPWPWGIPALVSMNSTASTSEHRDDDHRRAWQQHTYPVRCKLTYYPSCLAIGNTEITYSHASNSYTLPGSNH